MGKRRSFRSRLYTLDALVGSRVFKPMRLMGGEQSTKEGSSAIDDDDNDDDA